MSKQDLFIKEIEKKAKELRKENLEDLRKNINNQSYKTKIDNFIQRFDVALFSHTCCFSCE